MLYSNYNDDELLEVFGISFSDDKLENNNANIYIGDIHPESLNIALSIKNIIDDYKLGINVLISNNGECYILYKGKLFRSKVESIVYSCRNAVDSIIGPDMIGFSKLIDNKFDTTKLLNNLGFSTPKEILLDKNISKLELKQKYLSFIQSIKNNYLVVKPIDKDRGEGIEIIKNNISFEDFYKKYVNGPVLLQEKIDSYKIEIDGKRKDWNLRAIVTYDLNSDSYICNGLFGRIGNFNNVINVSQGSDFIPIEELLKYLPDEFDENKIKHLSENVISKISEYLGNSGELLNTQDISGIDIIIDENLNVNILEINDSMGGGAYILSKYYGDDVMKNYFFNIVEKIFIYLQIKN